MNTASSVRLRTARFAFAAAFFWAAAAQAAEPEPPAWDENLAPAALKPAVVVDDGVVRLGDLFENAAPHAEKVVAYAPKPGQQNVIGVRWLIKAANYYRLDWAPETAADQVVVTRSSTVIKAEVFETAVRRTLAEEHGLEGRVTVEFDNPMLRVDAPGGSEPTVRIEAMRYDSESGRFAVVAAAPADAPAAQRLRISGRAFLMLNVPAPAERLARGDIISESDLIWVEVKARRLRKGAVTDAADLIGMSAKRPLDAERPVRKIDIQKPILVKRGALVTIRLNFGAMSLSAQGRALENGALGDVIRVSNTQSSQIIQAEVDGGGAVSVRMNNALAMN
ncbi:MAG: flagellar basal body P-ring formation chaperone FlgA [Rhodospirillales bacterium]